MGPTWGPPGSCRPQMGPMLAPRTLLWGKVWVTYVHPTPRTHITPHPMLVNFLVIFGRCHDNASAVITVEYRYYSADKQIFLPKQKLGKLTTRTSATPIPKPWLIQNMDRLPDFTKFVDAISKRIGIGHSYRQHCCLNIQARGFNASQDMTMTS